MGMPDVISIGNASPLKGAAMTSPLEDYRLIPLTQGQFAIVEASDFDWLNQWDWFARWDRCTKGFYASRSSLPISGRRGLIHMHRVVLGLEPTDPKRGDHINGNTLDNRRSNLRVATPSQNSMNRRNRATNTTGYKGVSLEAKNGLYRARIGINGSVRFLGYRATAKAAYEELYVPAARELFGEFAKC
jgi:hypothetical protein